MTLIRIGLLYPSILNSFITNKRIEVKLVQHNGVCNVVRYAFSNGYLFWGSKGVIGEINTLKSASTSAFKANLYHVHYKGNNKITELRAILQRDSQNCENRNDPDLVQAFLKKWRVESDIKAPNLPLSLRLKCSGCHYNSMYNNIGTK